MFFSNPNTVSSSWDPILDYSLGDPLQHFILSTSEVQVSSPRTRFLSFRLWLMSSSHFSNLDPLTIPYFYTPFPPFLKWALRFPPQGFMLALPPAMLLFLSSFSSWGPVPSSNTSWESLSSHHRLHPTLFISFITVFITRNCLAYLFIYYLLSVSPTSKDMHTRADTFFFFCLVHSGVPCAQNNPWPLVGRCSIDIHWINKLHLVIQVRKLGAFFFSLLEPLLERSIKPSWLHLSHDPWLHPLSPIVMPSVPIAALINSEAAQWVLSGPFCDLRLVNLVG